MYPFSNPSLHPQFVIAQYGDAWTVTTFIASESTATGEKTLAPGTYLISGPAADLLYLCLCGHKHGTPGTLAAPSVARIARAHLQAIAPQPGGYWLANRVVQHWGDHIWPEMVRPKSERIR